MLRERIEKLFIFAGLACIVFAGMAADESHISVTLSLALAGIAGIGISALIEAY